ncbi:tyrosine-type recombinase/integrase [Patescibacteria group bacterium]
METTNLQELLDRYLHHCATLRGYAPRTIDGYKNTFKLFFRESEVRHTHELNLKVFEEWFIHGRMERKWTPVTFRGHLKYLNTFMKWLIKEGLVEQNYLDKLEKPRLEHKIPRTLSKKEAELILEASFHLSYPYRFAKYRNRAIVAIMLMAGLRRQEVIKLCLNDVSVENKSIFIRQAKWGKDRIVPMNQKLQQILYEYQQDRRRLKKQNIHFFTSIQKDNQIGDRAITNIIKKLRDTTKIYFSAHTLRHAFARLMLEGGCDIYTLSKLMGHSKITTTTIYLSCSNQQMSKAVEMHSLN